MRVDPKLWRKARSLFYVTTGGFGCFAGFSIYKGSETFYNEYLMPVVHVLNPETSHHIAVIVSKYNLLPRSSYSDPERLKNKVWGLDFSNPVGIAAGFDKHGEAVESLHRIGFGFVEVGSVTPLPQPGNNRPRVFSLKSDGAIINRYGFNSDGHEAVLKRLKTIKEDRSFHGVLGVNLGKNKNSKDTIKDYVLGIERFGNTADYLVINISSPNTPGLRQLQNKEQLQQLLSALVAARDALPKKTPLLLKLAPDLTDQERKDIAQVISQKKCKVDGLVISNTTILRPNLRSAGSDEEGGLSGRPLHSISTQLISDMYRYTNGTIPIIGVGGIFSGQDALDKIKAGASLIQLYTAFAFHGPPRVVRVKRELDELLTAAGYESVAQAVGTAK